MALMSQHWTSGTLTWRQLTTRHKFDDSKTQLYFLYEDKTFGLINTNENMVSKINFQTYKWQLEKTATPLVLLSFAADSV